MARSNKITEHGELVTLLQQITKTERRAVLLSELSRIIQKALGAKDIPLDKGFFDSGMDSLMAVEVRNSIQQALGTEYRISNTLLFEQTNLTALAEYLERQVLFNVFEQEKQEKPSSLVQQVLLDEPIAIIGMDCRLPGGANNSKQFWELLSQGYDGISEVPPSRWDIEQYYDPNPGNQSSQPLRYPHEIYPVLASKLIKKLGIRTVFFFNASNSIFHAGARLQYPLK